jgi:hypothetical protein
LIHDLDFSHYELIERLRLADEGEKAIYKFNCQSGLEPINSLLLEHGGFRAVAQGHEQASPSGLDEPLRLQDSAAPGMPSRRRKNCSIFC